MIRSIQLMGVLSTLAMSACAGAGTPALGGQSYSGWYMERAGQGLFQPCGKSQQWRVLGSSDLQSRARQFGLDENTPVYVIVSGTHVPTEDQINVTGVQQFGSSTPVRNCAMTGVVIPASSPH